MAYHDQYKTKYVLDLFNLRKWVFQLQTNLDFIWNLLPKVLIIFLCWSLSSLIEDLPVRHDRTFHSFIKMVANSTMSSMLNSTVLKFPFLWPKQVSYSDKFPFLIKFTCTVWSFNLLEWKGEGIWLAGNIILFLAKINWQMLIARGFWRINARAVEINEVIRIAHVSYFNNIKACM